MNETVYIETSIIGYLTARPSNNLILMANLETTREWWDIRRNQFILYISQIVLDEVARGDVEITDLNYYVTFLCLKLTKQFKI